MTLYTFPLIEKHYKIKALKHCQRFDARSISSQYKE